MKITPHLLPSLAALAVIATCILPATAQVPDQLKSSIFPPVAITQAQSGEQFGASVAVDGAYTVVGAPSRDAGAVDAGVAKVFDSVSGTLLFVLPNPSPATGDSFGNSVAISGTRVVVGAVSDDTGATDAGSAYIYDLASATPTVPVLALNNPSPAVGDSFGWSVGISGTRVVVGAPNDHTGADYAGSAYGYDLSSGTPTVPVALLENPSPETYDQFGYSVAISGARVIVGAYQDDTGASNAGSAYVYDLSSGTPTLPVAALFNPSPEMNDYFGLSVAISGTRAVVGALYDDTGATDAGSAYVYDLASATPTEPMATLNNPGPATNDYFGYSVGISGTLVLVGAHEDDTGATDAGSAYVYDLSGETPGVPEATLDNPSPADFDEFGSAVAISGSRVVVGALSDDTGAADAGSAYIYDVFPTVLVAALNHIAPTPGENFGFSVAVSGTLVVVGAPYDDAGSALIHDLSSEAPSLPIFTLPNPDPAAGDGFGGSVAISGSRVVIGASLDDTAATGSGSAYVYDLASATPTVPVLTLNNPSPAENDRFGVSVAIAGTRVIVGAHNDDAGANDAGSAYVYDLSSGTPSVPVLTLNNPSPGASDHFGISVGVSGARVVVGASGGSNVGTAHVYDLSGGAPTVPVATLNHPTPADNDFFGISVSISGTLVVVGANQDDTGATDAGSAYVYDLSSGTPAVAVVTLNNPTPADGDLFGVSVAISGTLLVVGADEVDTGASNAGSAYVYDLGGGTPTVPVATLNNPSFADGDSFGYSVAIDGTTVAIGAPFDDIVAFDKGAAYVFGPSPYSLWKFTEVGNINASDLDDPDSDGLGNLGEYGLLRSPTTPEGASFGAASALYAEGERLRLFVPRDPARNDITLEVQATGDLLLGPWTTIATSTLGAPFTGPGYFDGDAATPGVKSVEVRDTVNLPDAPQRFLRVRVRR